jgi:regulator of protease activity HflC (stomatin/prohibitin superfamily)
MRAVMSAVAFVFIAWVLMMLFIVQSVVKVPADSAYVVKTLGRVSRVLDPGLHLVVPIISQVAARISMLDQVLDVPVASCAMSNGTRLSVRGTVRFRVSDPARAVAEVADFRAALPKLATSEWTRVLGESDPLDALTAVRASESTIRTAAAAWGIDVLSASPILILDDDATSLLGARDAPG